MGARRKNAVLTGGNENRTPESPFGGLDRNEVNIPDTKFAAAGAVNRIVKV